MRDWSHVVPDAAAFDRRLSGALASAVGHSVVILAMKARGEHRWKDITFATRRSLEPEFTATGKGAEGFLKATDNAARMAFGTKPHRIEARNARALRFKMGGETMFRRGVNHPGTSPDPYLDRAAEAAGEELFRAFESELDRLL